MNVEHEELVPSTGTKPKSKTSSVRNELASACIEHGINIHSVTCEALVGVLPDNYTVLEDGTKLRVKLGDTDFQISRSRLSRCIEERARYMGWSELRISKLTSATDA